MQSLKKPENVGAFSGVLNSDSTQKLLNHPKKQKYEKTQFN